MDESRKEDTKVIEQGLKSKDPTERLVAGNARDKIRREQADGWTREARRRLIEETKKGNEGNATDIRDAMVKRRGGRLGQNVDQVINATITWEPGRYEEVFGHD